LKPQYSHDEISIAPAHADEPLLPAFSVAKAEQYLRDGARAWKGSKDCVSCHTTGLYLQVRPELTPLLGPPMAEMREFFLTELAHLKSLPRDTQLSRTHPAQFIYVAAGLAEWDSHVNRSLSAATRDAIRAMLALQLTNGSWGSLECWPPYESDAFHLANTAAMTLATAPGWLKSADATEHATRIAQLRTYLQNTPPPHDYGRVLLLWTATRWSGLLTAPQRDAIREMILKHQQADGGWSLRSFATPEQWGNGNRAAKLRAEPEFAAPPSDGHMSGLALVVLRDAGLPANDPHVQRGVAWLKRNQRESGRWWARSLNTDSWHYLTYSATAFPLLALAKCNELPALSAK
jgi:squalene-hopene/tetraprenyl-beta-curcumene cyclase